MSTPKSRGAKRKASPSFQKWGGGMSPCLPRIHAHLMSWRM